MMLAADSWLPFGANWYDLFVLLALVYGVWSGVHNGLTAELISLIGIVLMVALALQWYEELGARIREWTGLVMELANMTAFVAIAVLVYALTVLGRSLARRWTRKSRFSPKLESIGGGLAGFIRMLAAAIWVTVVLCLTRSPTWHQQVGENSRFGSFVVGQLPPVASIVEQHFPETLWFLRDIERPEEPGIEENKAPNH